VPDSASVSAAARLRTALETRDLDSAVAQLAPDVVFRSPIVHKPYHGPEAVRALLEGVMAVFEDFRYERVIGAPDAADHALVFVARIGERELEGCDFLHENADDLIDEFVVMVRPLTGALALAEGMRAHFEGTVPAP
jgi:limonene-1,2-epoxide hydrolase